MIKEILPNTPDCAIGFSLQALLVKSLSHPPNKENDFVSICDTVVEIKSMQKRFLKNIFVTEQFLQSVCKHNNEEYRWGERAHVYSNKETGKIG